ncbi:TonB-dependent receptor [Acinetobacter boissieri]|uniref:Catecholate siderophore receptor n=1 Tax=Acinetobacter boissieri TaxID=1219383 RepID=A0A1G6J8F1_9GAMM|nr:TonB-dependent siderophore receptor [Acinetobacter boissieri]SDC14833.1 catecholate siderophore receptor [Acinetobacter boissieri]
MSFIKTRKKIVSSALLSSLSIASGTVIAGQDAANLPTISAHGLEASLKVDKSANSKYLVPLLDTAKSVDVISSKLIKDTQVTTLSDALRTVPGITLGAGEGGNPNGDRPFIRGYNSESSIYVDGVRNATSQQREMFDVEQVEVTKGSASTLGGGGSTGGNINIITKLPKLTDAVEGSISSGTDDYRRIVLDGNKNFDNGIASRVVVMGHQNTKAGQKDGAEYNRVGIAPSIIFGTNSPTKATLSYYYLRTNDTPDSGVPYSNPKGTGVYGKPVDVKQGIYYGLHNRDFQKQENHIGTFKLEHAFDNGFNLSNIVTYNRSKNDYIWTQPDDSQGDVTYGKVWRRANSSITDTETFADQLALQGKFNTGSITHRLSLGADYSHQATDKGSYGVTSGLSAAQSCGTGTNKTNPTYGIGTTNGYCTSLYNPNSYDAWSSKLISGYTLKNTTKNTGLYILDNIEFTPQWLLDLGVRWDNFNTKQYNYATVSSTAYTAMAIPTTVISKSNFFSYTAGLTYKPVEQGSIYASFATSANPVGISAGDGSESIAEIYKALQPEKARTFEIGTKWDLFDRRANVTAAVFRTEKQNTRIAVSPTQYTNGGASRVNGFEFGLNGNITNNWDITLGYSYLDAIQSGNPGVSTRDGSAIQTRGKQLPNVPKNSATLWSTYKITPKLTLGGGVVASDKVYGSTTNTLWVSGYTRYDVMARYAINKNIDIQLNVNNVSNTRYFTKAYASHYATEAEGRNGVLTLNFKY